MAYSGIGTGVGVSSAGRAPQRFPATSDKANPGSASSAVTRIDPQNYSLQFDRAADLFGEGVEPCKPDIEQKFGSIGTKAITAGYLFSGALGALYMLGATVVGLFVVTPVIAGLRKTLPYLMKGRAGLIANDLKQTRTKVETWTTEVDRAMDGSEKFLLRTQQYLPGYRNCHYANALPLSRERSREHQVAQQAYLKKQRREYGLPLYHSSPADCLDVLNRTPENTIASRIKRRDLPNNLPRQNTGATTRSMSEWTKHQTINAHERDEHNLRCAMNSLSRRTKQVDGLIERLGEATQDEHTLSQMFQQAGTKLLYFVASWWDGEKPLVR